MKYFIINNFYIFLSIFLGVISQLIVKWKMSTITFGSHDTIYDKFTLVFFMLLDPYIIASVILTLFAGLSWMIAMTKFDISYAYPFTILGFILVLIFSVMIFDEPLTREKIIGIILITSGIIVSSQSL